MCGVAGTVDLAARSTEEALRAAVSVMTATMSHRGPDDSGVWLDAAAGVALGHRRLSIVDLSPLGHQPMISADGRYVIAYNGELYNHQHVRARLTAAGVTFRSHSDTEVLVEAIAAWGVHRTLVESNGMWAFAVFDRHHRVLTLAVDRFGEKPMYVGLGDRWMLFGSELKALVAHPAFTGVVDRDALAAYFRTACMPAPFSIYQGVHRLPGGTFLEVPLDGSPPVWRPRAWWSVLDVAAQGAVAPVVEPDDLVIDRVSDALASSVGLRMVADVPVGAFLSGGVDSSLIVALMRQQADDVRTFSIGFDDDSFNEAPYAAAVAKHLGTDHTELYVTSDDVMDLIPSLPAVYDEPFADSSQLPTALLASLTRAHVTVALSGDAGDELFAGYDRYAVQQRLAGIYRRVPVWAREAVAKAVLAVPPGAWTTVAGVVPRLRRQVRVGDRAHKLAEVIGGRSVDEAYIRLMSSWPDPGRLVLGADEPGTALTAPSQWLEGAPLQRARYVDQVAYLPDDILTKVDRASMAASLEARIPFLDPRVVELAWAIPPAVHRRDGRGKYVLRSLLARHVPTELMDRPKRGFAVPIGAWLRGPLRPWAQELLAPDRLAAEGYLDGDVVQLVWQEHLSGARDWTSRLWSVLMWEAWLDRWRPSTS